MTKEKLIKWAQEKMYNNITNIEKIINDSGRYQKLELTGNRYDLAITFPYEISCRYDYDLMYLTTVDQKKFLENFIKIWTLGIEVSYVDCFSEKEQNRIRREAKIYGVERKEPSIIKFNGGR